MYVGPRTTLHFIRHADAVPDHDAHIEDTGGYDMLGLSVKGAAQARALARRLAETTRLAAVYASPTRRAFETATAVGEAARLPINVDERMKEIYLGDESVGHVAPAERAPLVRERLKAFAAMAIRDGTWAGLPDAESGAAVRARMLAAVTEIVAQHPDAHVAIVSHAGSINAYLAGVVGVSRDFFFPIRNTSLSSVRVFREQTLLLRLNDTAHLERARATTDEE
ncbi:MAG: histidine phosphatase family protein [Candidatus Eremiobacteraeota bacterium]|nr:histidine phosphatase family protein [Candidatus Eremiobacteraeota bacterium]